MGRWICIWLALGIPGGAQTTHFGFAYPDRTSLVAAGWDYLAVTATGATRNTEQTTGAVVSYDQTAHPGILQIPVDSGDLWGSLNNSRNTLFHSVPTTWTSLRLSLSFNPTTAYQQAGLVAYQDDDNYVNISRIFNGGNLVSLAAEQGGNPAVLSSAAVTATTLYLRLDRDLTTNTIAGSYSTDGTTWIQVGSTIQQINNPQLAIFVGGSPGGFPQANLSWAEYDQNPTTLSVTSISATPASVIGGTGAQGTITMNSAAPAGGAVVTLGSSNGSIASVPSIVTVGTGLTSATFAISTVAVSAVTSVTLTATYGTTSVNTTLTVQPWSSSLTQYNFTYANRTSLLAAGWDFTAVTASGATRNTEQTTGAVVSYDQTAHPGILQIPVDSGDLWGSLNNSRNTLFHSVPANWTSLRLSLSFNPTTAYQQAGLVAYQDDDNYVNITRILNGGNLVSLAAEQGGNPAVLSSAAVTATTLYLQLDRDLTTNTITGSYSTDGTTWIQLGSTVQQINNPQLAIFVGGSPGGLPPANLSWAQVASGVSGIGVSLTLNPASVTGGRNSQGSVTLSSAAPAAGAVVTLGSSNTSVASVPPTVTVAAGSPSATFSVATSPVATVNTPTITATYAPAQATATLTVNPAGVILTLNPSSVTGGSSSQGTVTLSSAAPAGGALITLGSSNTSVASVPPTVTVAANSTSATFPITTSIVSSVNAPTLTATYGSASSAAILTVNQPNFTYKRTITITNTGSALTNYQIQISLNSANMNFSHAKPDGSDLRLRASDGVTDLPYWIEQWNSVGQTATLWVKASALPAGTSTLYLVYGNPGATTTASGTNTFAFYDDFEAADATPQYGYMQESAIGIVDMGASQGWETPDVPHFISVLPTGGTIDGVTYAYFGYYGVHTLPGYGIGLAGSNDLVNWTKYSGNPVIPSGTRSPSVINDGSTYRMAYELNSSEIGYAISPDGINWTVQTPLVSVSGINSTTPHLWQNPSDRKYYLFWASAAPDDSQSTIQARSASTAAGLYTASNVTVWNNWLGDTPDGPVNPFYAPHMYYDAGSSTYLLMLESQPPLPNVGDADWDVIVLQSSQPTSGFTLTPGNSYHPNGYACPQNYPVNGILYTYYCYYTGSEWQIRYTTATITAGRQPYPVPKKTLWTDVEPASNTQKPNWFLTSCTDWQGKAGQCLKGFGRFGQAYNGQTTPSYLASSYIGTDYILEARIYPIDHRDATIAVRITGPSVPGSGFNAMLYYDVQGLYEVVTPGWNQVSVVSLASAPLNTWYHVVMTAAGATFTTTINQGAYSTSGTSGAIASGSAGPGLDMQATSMFDNIFVHQYAASPPTNTVGSEQTGSF